MSAPRSPETTHDACRRPRSHPPYRRIVRPASDLVASRLGSVAEIRFLGDLAAGNLIAEPVAAADWMRIAELVGRYRDLPLGTVDASVIAAAERLGSTEIATLDRRHVTVVRSDLGALTLLP